MKKSQNNLVLMLCLIILTSLVIMVGCKGSNSTSDTETPQNEKVSQSELETDVPDIQDYIYQVQIDDSNFFDFFEIGFVPCVDFNKEEVGEYLLILRDKKTDEGLVLLDASKYDVAITLDFETSSVESGASIEWLYSGVPWGHITDPAEVSVTMKCSRQVFTFVREEFVESYEIGEPTYYEDYPIWYSIETITLKDGTIITRLISPDSLD